MGGKLIRQTDGTNTLDFFYDESGHPYAVTHSTSEGSNTYYYVTNLQGDVLKIVYKDEDDAIQVAASYTYDPYGKVLTATGTLAEVNPLRYRGYVYDSETGFYYLQSRYYDPNIGRFINADRYTSTGQGIIGHNMFAYCRNNPVRRVDIAGSADADCYDDDPLDEEDRLETGRGGGGGHTSTATGGGHASTATGGGSVAQGNTQTGNLASNPLQNITYTPKVLGQMQQGDFHSFPKIVDNYGGYGTMTTFVGGDGNAYYRLAIPGSYGNYDGHFVYIWDANNNCNHRLFEVCK